MFHKRLVRKHVFVVQVNTFNTENYKPWDFQNVVYHFFDRDSKKFVQIPVYEEPTKPFKCSIFPSILKIQFTKMVDQTLESSLDVLLFYDALYDVIY